MATKAATTLEDLKTEARRNWQKWARDLASGKPMPPARDLIDAGIILGYEQPADRLEQDAAVVKRYTALRADFDATGMAIAAIAKANEGLEPEIAKLEAELEELRSRRMADVGLGYERGTARRRMHELLRAHPEVLAGEEVPS
jgi:hypothetical protein